MDLRTFPYQKAAAVVVCAAGAGVAVWIGWRWVLPILLPFAVAWGLAFLARPAAVWLHKRCRIPRKVASLCLVLTVPAAVLCAVWWLCAVLVRQAGQMLARLQADPGQIEAAAERLSAPFSGLLSSLPQSVSDGVAALPEQLVERAVDGAQRLASAVLVRAPGALVFLLVTLVACVFFSLELERVNAAVLRRLPPSWAAGLRSARRRSFSLAGRYVCAYLKLMGVTFSLLLAGFLIMRMPYALLLSAVFALVDFLPVLGVGTVLVPWALGCLVLGRTGRGVSLLVLWLVTVCVREFLEPRLVGRGLGVPALWMLFCFFAGLRLFGLWGFVVGPVLAVLTKAWLIGRSKDPAREVRRPSDGPQSPSPPTRSPSA